MSGLEIFINNPKHGNTLDKVLEAKDLNTVLPDEQGIGIKRQIVRQV